MHRLVWTSALRTLGGGSGQGPVLVSAGFPVRLTDPRLPTWCRPLHAQGSAHALPPLGEPRWDAVRREHSDEGDVVALLRHAGVDAQGRPGRSLVELRIGDTTTASAAVALALDPSSVVEWDVTDSPERDASADGGPAPAPSAVETPPSVEGLVAVILGTWLDQEPTVLVVPRHDDLLAAVHEAVLSVPTEVDETLTFSTQEAEPDGSPVLLAICDPVISRVGTRRRVVKVEHLDRLDADAAGPHVARISRELIALRREGGTLDDLPPCTLPALLAWAEERESLRRPPSMLRHDELLDAFAGVGPRRRDAGDPAWNEELRRRCGERSFVDAWLARPEITLDRSLVAAVRGDALVLATRAAQFGRWDALSMRVLGHVAPGARPLDPALLDVLARAPWEAQFEPPLQAELERAALQAPTDVNDDILARRHRWPSIALKAPEDVQRRLVESWLIGRTVPGPVVLALWDQRRATVLRGVRRRVDVSGDPRRELDAAARALDVLRPGGGADLAGRVTLSAVDRRPESRETRVSRAPRVWAMPAARDRPGPEPHSASRPRRRSRMPRASSRPRRRPETPRVSFSALVVLLAVAFAVTALTAPRPIVAVAGAAVFLVLGGLAGRRRGSGGHNDV